MKKHGAGSVLVRLGLLTILVTGGYVGYQKLGQGQQLAEVAGKVEGLTTALHLDGLLSAANKKLVESQPIISEQVDSASTDVLGDTTSNITDTARQFVEDTASQISDQIKDLPRQEAVNITKSVCEQIIKDLEKK